MTLRLTRLAAAQYPCLIIAKSTNAELSHAPQSGRGELGCGNADGHPGARPGDEARRVTRCPSRGQPLPRDFQTGVARGRRRVGPRRARVALRARHFIVACGAVNSAALLLRSGSNRYPDSLANSSG